MIKVFKMNTFITNQIKHVFPLFAFHSLFLKYSMSYAIVYCLEVVLYIYLVELRVFYRVVETFFPS